MAAAVIYKIGSTTFDSLGVKVESATGLLSVPKRKTPVSIDWPEYHGKVVDTAAPRYQEREIVLNCMASGTTGADIYAAVGSLASLLTGAGLKVLTVIYGTTTLTYNVYLEEIGNPAKSWGGGKVIGRFAVKLKEPEPSLFLPSTT